MYETNMYESMIAETITMHGAFGDVINAYFARPLGAGPFPGMVLIHHLPGWDEWYREATRKFAHHGYAAISPNLYFRDGHGTPEDVAAKVRGGGGIPDDQAVGDIDGAMRYLRSLPLINGLVNNLNILPAFQGLQIIPCPVGRAIVNEDEFAIIVAVLTVQGPDHARQGRSLVVDGDDERYRIHRPNLARSRAAAKSTRRRCGYQASRNSMSPYARQLRPVDCHAFACRRAIRRQPMCRDRGRTG